VELTSDRLDFAATSREIMVDGRRVHYHEAGTGPGVVLLHGGGPGASGWSNYSEVFDAFAEKFRTVVVDLPGFGRTEPPPKYEKPYPSVGAASVKAVLEELGMDRVSLVGNSLGANVAGHLALDPTITIDRLVLIGPGGLSLNIFSAAPSQGLARVFEFIKNPCRDTLSAFLKLMVFDQSKVTDALVEERMATAMQPETLKSFRHIWASFSDPRIAGQFQEWTTLRQIGQPTLILWGREDQLETLDGAFLPLHLLPNVELHVFSKCGHWTHIERREDFVRLATDFLDQ
jgi:4,5:9,10-diseco-3-hydroxy-5,9,17-trioxoandrosta-1(10),2-diene-4-oate hydrolase